MNLLAYAKDVNTTNGEDGIIKKILEVLPNKNYQCVEFGAWDGLKGSNTKRLIDEDGFYGVLIEGNQYRYRHLTENYGNKRVLAINKYVGFGTDDNLDAILSNTPISRDFDFLSIDIDGNDYHVWAATTVYRPKAIVIEFNPSIPLGIEFIQPPDPKTSYGSSLDALVSLGRRKSYELVVVQRFNAYFVDSSYFPLFDIEDNTPEFLRLDKSDITYIFSGYDGTIFLSGSERLYGHNLKLRYSDFQVMPKFLRSQPGYQTLFQKILLFLFLLFKDREKLILAIQKRIKNRILI